MAWVIFPVPRAAKCSQPELPRHHLRATAWTSASQFSRRQRTAGEELALLLAPITLKAKVGREGALSLAGETIYIANRTRFYYDYL
jgi:hypothetical protein